MQDIYAGLYKATHHCLPFNRLLPPKAPFTQKGIQNYSFRFIERPNDTTVHALMRKNKEGNDRNPAYYSVSFMPRGKEHKNIIASFACPQQARQIAQMLDADVCVLSLSLHEFSYIATQLLHLPLIVILDSQCMLSDKDNVHFTLFYTQKVVGEHNDIMHEQTYYQERQKDDG